MRLTSHEDLPLFKSSSLAQHPTLAQARQKRREYSVSVVRRILLLVKAPISARSIVP
jgi:hypothetical protein